MVMVDMFGNYKWVGELKKLSTDEVIRIMEDWFCSAGLPRCIRSDGGPQFRSTYSNWLASLGVIQETSSPYNSASNGLAEKAIKDVKNMLKRQTGRSSISKLVAEHNGIARTHMDASPADLFFNRVVRTSTPASGRRKIDMEKELQRRAEEQKNIRKKLGRGRLNLDTFEKGDRVRLQDIKKKTWDTKGTIVSVEFHEGAQTPSSYHIAADEGGVFLRNGKFIRVARRAGIFPEGG